MVAARVARSTALAVAALCSAAPAARADAYVVQTFLADLGSDGLIGLGSELEGTLSKVAISVGMAGVVVAAPLVHIANDDTRLGLIDLGIRGALVGAVFGGMASCRGNDSCVAPIVISAAGVLAMQLVDVALLSNGDDYDSASRRAGVMVTLVAGRL